MRVPLMIFLGATLLGCGQKTENPATPPTVFEASSTGGHSHEKGTMLLADAGRYHALLTAHLSKDGNELDIFFETAGKTPQAVALPLATLKASVQIRTVDGGLKEVEFVPASADERPKGEAAGTCSHFVAKVPWLGPDIEHRVIVRVVLDGKDEEIRWNSFIPRKYAHHTD